MEDLDTIVEAISNILLVFEEAQNDLTTDIIVDPKNLDRLVVEVNRMVADNSSNAQQIKDQNIRSRYDQANTEITKSCSKLTSIIKQQTGSVVERKAYQPLHTELKSILQNLVLEVQIVDFVNCSIVLELCKRNLDCLIRMRRVTTDTTNYTPKSAVTAVLFVHREFSKVSGDLQMNAGARAASITDSELRPRIINAIEALRTKTPTCLPVIQRGIQSASFGDIENKEKALLELATAVEDILHVIQLSSAFVAGFAMNFPYPDFLPRPVQALAHVDDENEYIRPPRVAQELARLDDALVRADQKDAMAAAKAFAEEVRKQTGLAKAMAAQKEDLTAKAELIKLADQLEAVTADVITATKESLLHPKDQAYLKQFRDKAEQANLINSRIEDAKKPEKALVRAVRELETTLAQLADAANRGDVAGAVANAKKVADQMQRQVDQARAYADTVTDPKRKAAILEAADELERMIAQVAQATKDVLENPKDQAAKDRLAAVIQQANDAAARLAAAIIENELAKNKKHLADVTSELQKAALAGDSAKANELLKDTTDLLRRRIELGRELAEQVKDPALKKQILDACDALEKLIPELEKAIADVLKNPKDEAARKRLQDILDQINKQSERITAEKKFPVAMGVGKGRSGISKINPNMKAAEAAADIRVSATNLDNELTKLSQAVKKGDAKEADRAIAEIDKHILQEVELAEHLASKTTDEAHKQALLQAAQKLDAQRAPLKQITKEVLANPKDEALQKKFDNMIEQTRSANKVLAEAADRAANPKKVLTPMSASKEALEKPEMSEFRADGTKDEIMVAAHKVSAAVKTSKNVTPEQTSLRSLAAELSAQMELLSLAAQSKNKKEMVAASRKIAEMILTIQKLSNEVAAKCGDKVCKDALLDASKVPKNFATQLKILAAVKASSDDDDPTAENQLITCAKGLANSVVNVVKAAEAAAVKTIKV